MKRSAVNSAIEQGICFLNKMNCFLPPFAYWSPAEWGEKGHEYDEIRDCMLGWDITDFGSDDFDHVGLLVFTVRNGILGSKKYFKEYAEKYLIVQPGQVTPMHFHYYKMEDIINRGGADLVIELYNSDKNQILADTCVQADIDGRRFKVKPGARLTLKSGESITLAPGQYHSFWADGGVALIGEVSKVNDDHTDNHFFKAPARFPVIEEDEAAKYLLFSEYPNAADQFLQTEK